MCRKVQKKTGWYFREENLHHFIECWFCRRVPDQQNGVMVNIIFLKYYEMWFLIIGLFANCLVVID